MHTMRRLIKLAALIGCCHVVVAVPGIVDSPELRKSREKSSFATSPNSIATAEASEKSINEFQPMKITHNDVVVTGASSVYGSHPQFSSGGIIFAITGQSSSAPIMSAAPAQPVLLQYLSPEGVPKQTAAIQYIQLLRPLMMLPAQPYRSMSATSVPIETATTTMDSKPEPFHPYSPYMKPLLGAHSVPLLSYVQSNPRPLITPTVPNGSIGLNTNEYIPAASSRVATSVASPQASTAFRPSNMAILAQRA